MEASFIATPFCFCFLADRFRSSDAGDRTVFLGVGDRSRRPPASASALELVFFCFFGVSEERLEAGRTFSLTKEGASFSLVRLYDDESERVLVVLLDWVEELVLERGVLSMRLP